MVARTGSARADTMDGQWLSYEEAAVRLGCTPEAARRRAIRGKWARMPGNDGRTRVRVPDDRRPQGAPPVRPDDSALLHALEAHIVTLKGENETLKGQLAAAVASLAAERAQTEKAIAAFAALADRLDALAVERLRPWWRRLAG
jgi:hypothetical protein